LRSADQTLLLGQQTGVRRRDSALCRAEPQSGQRPFHPRPPDCMVRPSGRLPRSYEAQRLNASSAFGTQEAGEGPSHSPHGSRPPVLVPDDDGVSPRVFVRQWLGLHRIWKWRVKQTEYTGDFP
jgi:hypothetical protein